MLIRLPLTSQCYIKQNRHMVNKGALSIIKCCVCTRPSTLQLCWENNIDLPQQINLEGRPQGARQLSSSISGKPLQSATSTAEQIFY